MTITEIYEESQKSSICEQIIYKLPDWFGIPESNAEYIQSVKPLKFFAVFDGDAPVGYIALEDHNPHTSEVHIIGILPEYHRQGIGRKLIDLAVDYCAETGRTFLTVKTIDDSDPYEPYARTRAFYRSCGFLSVEVLKGYWDENNPCLLMAKITEKR